MSKRSLFPDGVVVTTDDLTRTEEARSEQTRNVVRELSAYPRLGSTGASRGNGIVEGLRVTVNGANINVSSGTAYVVNGERVVVDTDQVAVPLSDYTDGTTNLVALVYTETADTPRAHETDGTSPNTAVTPGFRIRCYTQAQFNALPATATDMTLDAVDRALVIATVLGNGITAGVANSLVSGEVSQVALSGIVAVEYTAGQTPLAGVNLASCSVTSTGTGTLELVQAAGVSTLRFSPPGGSFGAGTVVTAGGTFTVTGSGSQTLTVTTDADLLLGNGDATFTPTLTFSNLYDVLTAGPHFSAADNVHRSRTSGLIAPEANNPHGMDGSLLGHGYVDLPNYVRIGANVPVSNARSNIPRETLIGTATGTRQNMLEFAARLASLAGDKEIRFYRVGVAGGLEITYNARWDNVGALWSHDDTAVNAYKLRLGYSSGAGPLGLQFRLGAASTWADGAWTDMLTSDPITGFSLLTTVDTSRLLASIIDSPTTWAMDTTTFRYSVSPLDVAPLPPAAVSMSFGFGAPPTGTGAAPANAPSVIIASTAAAKGFLIPLHLPEGAVVTGATARVVVTLGADAARSTIIRIPLTGAGSYGSMNSAGAGYDSWADTAAAIADRTLTINQNQTIDNDNFAYYWWVSNDGSANNLALTFYGGFVTYTLDEPFTW